MMPLKEKDFIEIEFIARDKETNKVFDLTDKETAKKEKIYNEKAEYGPIIICIGEHQIIKGLDSFLIGKEINREYKVELSPEEGFGKKDTKLLRLIPSKLFKKQNIQPFPGLQINIDGLLGIVRTVSSGRSIVDFNHPLAGHTLVYSLKINRIITKDDEKINSFLKFFIKDPKIKLEDNNLTVESPIPEPIQKLLKEKIKKLTPNIKEIKFSKTNDKA